MKTKLFFLASFFYSIFIFSQTVAIPDTNFEQALIDLGYDDVLDGFVANNNINSIEILDIKFKSIKDLTGIEGFAALKFLNVDGNSLSVLDFSANLNLQELDASSIGLTAINLSKNVLLQSLEANSNSDLTTIDLSNNTNLKELSLFNCRKLTSLDLTTNILLETLSLYLNNLPAISTKGMTNLKSLNINGNSAISVLDVTENPNLEVLDIGSTQVNTLNLEGKTALTHLDISYTDVSALDITACTQLKKIEFEGTEIATLDLSNNILLEDLTFNSKITNFNTTEFTNLKKIQNFETVKTSLETLDLSKSTALEFVFIQNAESLQKLNLQNGNNTNFNISGGRFVFGNALNLKCVQVDNPTYSSLEWIDKTGLGASLVFPPFANIPYSSFCFENGTYIPDDNFEQALIDLNLDFELDNYVQTSTLNTVISINLSNKNINDLTGIEDFSILEVLDIQKNNLATVDLSKNTNILSLSIHENELETLDLSTNTKLTRINCDFNKLTTLDLSKNIALTDISVTDNELKELNIKNGNNANVFYFQIGNNPDLSCVQVDNATASQQKWPGFFNAGINFSENCNFSTYIPNLNFEQALIDLGYDDVIDSYVATRNINTITDLFISNKQITDLTGIENFTALTSLDVSNNLLPILDISKNTALLYLSFSQNNISAIDLSQNTELGLLYCSDNNLTTLDVSKNVSLQYISTENNSLTSLDVSNNIFLQQLYCSGNEITSLDLSKNNILFALLCDTNNLTSLNIKNGNNANLTTFNATTNPNLSCIEVDNLNAIGATWFKDTTAAYSENCASLSVPNINKLQFTVHPNPSKGNLNIAVLEASNLFVYSVAGKQVLNRKLKVGKNQLNDLKIASGIYLFKVISKDKSSIKKVIIQ